MRLRSALLLLAALALPVAAHAAPLQPAEELLEGFKAERGLVTVHRKQHQAYLEVPASQLGQPFLLATSISGGPTYTGFQWQEMVCAWERIGDQLVLMEREVRYRVQNQRQPIASAVERTYTDRMLQAVPVLSERGGNPVIDLTALFGGSAQTFFGEVARELDARVVRVESLKTFPKNVAFTLTVPDKARDGRMTSLGYSFSFLPNPQADRYRPRLADDRVGYFLTAVKDFTNDTEGGDRFVRFVNRWDLRKADPGLARSPVAEPIVFYIENTVPYRFRHAVQQGILEWNRAFEAVGLLGAVVVRQQTDTEFADLDPADVRYNFFRWIVSERAFAMGPSRVNPWTGQILDADIVFDESMVRAYLREYDLALKKAPRRFFSPGMRRLLDEHPERFPFAHVAPELDAETALVAPPGDDLDAEACSVGAGVAHQVAFGLLAAGIEWDVFRGGEDAQFPQEFIEQIVKDVVMHEVGHTLGLRHNFKASAWRSLEEINGEGRPGDLCASVMDYNPINIQRDRGTTQGNYTMTTLGPYDRWAIRYGYDPDESALQATVAEVTSSQYAYATDEDTTGPDPFAARWDLGSDPLAFAKERMALASSLWNDVVERVVGEGESYDRARRAVDALLYDYQGAALTAARFVGGQLVNRYHRGDAGAPPPVVPVAAERQRAALDLVCDEVFRPGNFDLSPELLRHLAKGNWRHWGSRDGSLPHSYPYHDRVLTVQQWVLWGLINPETLGRIVDAEAKVAPDEELLTVPELFDRLTAAIFGPLVARDALTGTFTARTPAVGTVERNLQRHYTSELIRMTIEGEGGVTPAAARTVARLEAREVGDALAAVLARDGQGGLALDPYTRGHLEEVVGRLEQALAASFRIGQ